MNAPKPYTRSADRPRHLTPLQEAIAALDACASAYPAQWGQVERVLCVRATHHSIRLLPVARRRAA